MIYPLSVGPLAITGWLWDQGEANSDNNETDFYSCALPGLINSWREELQAPNAWFGSVQLQAYIQDAHFDWHNIPDERAAQQVRKELGLYYLTVPPSPPV